MSNRWIALVSSLLLAPGCAALHPIRGVPAAYMPPEFQAESREGKSTIDLSLLQRSQPDQYRIEAGDVLSVYVPGLLGSANTDPAVSSGDVPPINLPQNTSDLPSLGFPLTVRDDHTIQIPQLPALDVYGLTEREVEERIKFAVLNSGLLAKGPAPRIVVSISRKRTHRVLVVRQEPQMAQNTQMMSGTIDLGRAGKGTARTVELQAYENDVAHALAQPGVDGLPGLDARNVIYILRARNRRGGVSCQAPAYRPQVQTIRGQSPGRFPSRTSVSRGPFAYFESSQFNLSSRDVARGSNGPELRDPIPGYAHSSPPGTGQVPAGANSNPISSSRGGGQEYGVGNANTMSPVSSPRYAGHSMGVASAGPTTGRYAPAGHSMPQRPVQGSRYEPANIPVEYTYPQNSPLPVQPGNVNNVAPQPSLPNPTAPVVDPGPVSPGVSQYQPEPIPVFAEPAPTPIPQHHMGGVPGPSPMHGGHSPSMDVHQVWNNTLQQIDTTIEAEHIIKIPVRLGPGETLNLSEEDITLYDGDIVFIESRDTDVYFIGGLLGGGQFSLPRDRDLHVLEAVSLAQGTNRQSAGSQGLQSAGGISALNRDVTPSASRLIVLRQVGCGQTMTIEVDLYKALRYPHENILVQPRDMLILQYTPIEATAAFIQRNLFEGALLGIAAGQLRTGN